MSVSERFAARIDQIRAVFPQVIRTLDVHDQGDDFLVFEVNRMWIFRFPRNPAAQAALECEKRFLPMFEALSPLPVPQFQFGGNDFVGYRKIEGLLLTEHYLRWLPATTRSTIARQVGEFLSAIHSFPLTEARQIGLTEGWGGWRERAYQRFQAQVAPRLSATARKCSLEFFECFFGMDWKSVVIHGDFYPPDHLFYDRSRRQLCGVIDFGDLTIEDAATDLCNILETFGVDFMEDVMAHYAGDLGQDIWGRMQMRIRANPLFHAAYSLEYGFDSRFQDMLQTIEASFK